VTLDEMIAKAEQIARREFEHHRLREAISGILLRVDNPDADDIDDLIATARAEFEDWVATELPRLRAVFETGHDEVP